MFKTIGNGDFYFRAPFLSECTPAEESVLLNLTENLQRTDAQYQESRKTRKPISEEAAAAAQGATGFLDFTDESQNFFVKLDELRFTRHMLSEEIRKRFVKRLAADPNELLFDAEQSLSYIVTAITTGYSEESNCNHELDILDSYAETFKTSVNGEIIRQYLGFSTLYCCYQALSMAFPESYKFSGRFTSDSFPEAVGEDNTFGIALATMLSNSTTTILKYHDVFRKSHPYHDEQTYRKKADYDEYTETPEMLWIPSRKGYDSAFSLIKHGAAGLAVFDDGCNMENLVFSDGKLYLKDNPSEALTAAKLQDMYSKKPVEDIDIPLLRVFYSAFYSDYLNTKQLKDKYAINLHNLAERLHKSKNLASDSKRKDDLLNSVKAFHRVLGFVANSSGNGESQFPVLNFEGFEPDKNLLYVSSPYFSFLIRYYFSPDQPMIESPDKKKALPRQTYTHQHLVKTTIATEKSKAAVENVILITNLIAQAGSSGTPHIRAMELINNNSYLCQQYKNSSNRGQLLKRVFKKTLELLRTQTTLTEHYRDICLPDPDDIKNIPTISNIGTFVYRFPHKGKINAAETKE